MMTLSDQAIQCALNSTRTFSKFLTANDSGETQSHQYGILVSVDAVDIMFDREEVKRNSILDRSVKIFWPQIGRTIENGFKWYKTKTELRITRFGRGFELRKPVHTGSLFVLCENTRTDYTAFTLSKEDDIDDFLNYFGITPAETNRLIDTTSTCLESREKEAIDLFIYGLQVEFPLSEEMSAAARKIYSQVYYRYFLSGKNPIITDPDRILLDWTNAEYRLFRSVEQNRYGELVSHGFSNVDDFVQLALKVLNRRKSRAGKSLEHHLSAIFDENNLRYTAQGVTEGNKKPDFIFPSQEAYHNTTFPSEKLIMLAAKTTCKDRWRQIINEGDRFKDGNKYLCTLQQGITATQMDEMQSEKVILVVPAAYINTYPKQCKDRIWTLRKFIEYVRETEEL